MEEAKKPKESPFEAVEGDSWLLPLKKPIVFGTFLLTHVSSPDYHKNGKERMVVFSKVHDMDRYDALPVERKKEMIHDPKLVLLSEFKQIVQDEIEIAILSIKTSTLKLVK